MSRPPRSPCWAPPAPRTPRMGSLCPRGSLRLRGFSAFGADHMHSFLFGLFYVPP